MEKELEYITTKVFKRTLRNLKTLQLLTDETQLALLDRVVKEALAAEIDKRSEGGKLSAKDVIMNLPV